MSLRRGTVRLFGDRTSKDEYRSAYAGIWSHATLSQVAMAWTRVSFALHAPIVAAPHEQIRNLSVDRAKSLQLPRRF
uniref:hypothetical protein n=1 Tax=Burkholderia alba TaxID=2683677 RepID=UPI002B05AF74